MPFDSEDRKKDNKTGAAATKALKEFRAYKKRDPHSVVRASEFIKRRETERRKKLDPHSVVRESERRKKERRVPKN